MNIKIALCALLLLSASADAANLPTGTNFFTISANGKANGKAAVVNNGAMFGPDTPGTTTCGIQEALNACFYTNALGPVPGAGHLRFDYGVFEFSGQIVINDAYPLDMLWEGCGKVGTILKYNGTTNAIIDVGHANLPGPRMQFVCKGVGFAYTYDTNTACLLKLVDVNECYFEDCMWTTWQTISNSPYSTLNYINASPITAVGTVGAYIGQGLDNQHRFKNCTFYGLAAGLYEKGDHIRVEDTIFASCGYTATGAAYTNIYGRYVGSGRTATNILSMGGAVTLDGGAFTDVWLSRCHFHFCDAACVVYQGSGVWLRDCVYEGTKYCTLSDGDNYSIIVDDFTGLSLTASGDHIYDVASGVIGAVSGVATHWQKDSWTFGSLLDINAAGVSRFSISSAGVVNIPNLTASLPVYTSSGKNLVSGTAPVTSYAVGTAYTLTATPAQLTFGTTSPGITLATAGTYMITGTAGVKYASATYAGAQTITLKLRRTNNTAADLTSGSRAVELPVLTTFTGGDVMSTPSVIYAATAGDIVQLFGSVSATPSAGSVQTDSAEIIAVRIF